MAEIAKRLRFWWRRLRQLWRRSYWGQPSDPSPESPDEWDQAAP